MFEHKLEMRAQALTASDELARLNAAALLIEGVQVRRLAQAEVGIHLFYTRQGQLVPIEVTRLEQTNDGTAADSPEAKLKAGLETKLEAVAAAVRRYAEARQQALRELADGAATDDSLLTLPPVIRVYEEDGATLDLRSGLLTRRSPTAAERRALLLAALPLPIEWRAGTEKKGLRTED